MPTRCRAPPAGRSRPVTAGDQLHREQAARDDTLVCRGTEPESNVDAVFHPAAHAVLQLHVGLDARVLGAELVEKPPKDVLEGAPWADDAQWSIKANRRPPPMINQLSDSHAHVCGVARECLAPNLVFDLVQRADPARRLGSGRRFGVLRLEDFALSAPASPCVPTKSLRPGSSPVGRRTTTKRPLHPTP